MVRKDGAESRRERIAKIAADVQAAIYANKDLGYVLLKKIVAKEMIDTGLTRENVLNILLLLEEGGLFEVDQEKDQIRKAAV